MSSKPRRPRALVRIATGFSAWAALFIINYGMQAVGCRLAWDRVELWDAISLQRLQQVLLYGVGLGATLGIYIWIRRHQSAPSPGQTMAFIEKVSVSSALAACGAIAVSFVGVLWLTPC